MEFERLIAQMRHLALQAGTRIMEIYDADDFDVRAKSDDSPVTAADEAADALLRISGGGDAVLVKASNGVGLARLVERVAGGAAPCST